MKLRELADYINQNLKDHSTAKAVYVDGLLHEKVVVSVNQASGQDRIDITETVLSLWGWHLVLWYGKEDFADLKVVKSKNINLDILVIMAFINGAIEARREPLTETIHIPGNLVTPPPTNEPAPNTPAPEFSTEINP
jgi:hypothetical protein